MEKAFPKKGSTPEKERNLSQQEINIRILSYLYNKEEGTNGFHHDKLILELPFHFN
jgi:hypothetical protein